MTDPNAVASDLADALVLDESLAAMKAEDLLEWLESGGLMPNNDTLEDLEGVLGGPLDERDSLCDRLREVVEAS
jgi:hypothetical protein